MCRLSRNIKCYQGSWCYPQQAVFIIIIIIIIIYYYYLYKYTIK